LGGGLVAGWWLVAGAWCVVCGGPDLDTPFTLNPCLWPARVDHVTYLIVKRAPIIATRHPPPPPAIASGAPFGSLARASPAVALARSLADHVEDGSLEAATKWGVRYGGWGWGCTLFDYDNDADLDFAMVRQL